MGLGASARDHFSSSSLNCQPFFGFVTSSNGSKGALAGDASRPVDLTVRKLPATAPPTRPRVRSIRANAVLTPGLGANAMTIFPPPPLPAPEPPPPPPQGPCNEASLAQLGPQGYVSPSPGVNSDGITRPAPKEFVEDLHRLIVRFLRNPSTRCHRLHESHRSARVLVIGPTVGQCPSCLHRPTPQERTTSGQSRGLPTECCG